MRYSVALMNCGFLVTKFATPLGVELVKYSATGPFAISTRSRLSTGMMGVSENELASARPL